MELLFIQQSVAVGCVNLVFLLDRRPSVPLTCTASLLLYVSLDVLKSCRLCMYNTLKYCYTMDLPFSAKGKKKKRKRKREDCFHLMAQLISMVHIFFSVCV
ncbi:hypothetical protein Nepgr_015231 [Nepenthes gracilis]|uniref:Uncharacterized protein n=1 Tax=Nepenthes gracilis TaxID=150966 RepID=A0AAD3SMF6_NEPGR|nr:hypothetical protein Nepgr_015231 [Nepenthes gracilis]